MDASVGGSDGIPDSPVVDDSLIQMNDVSILFPLLANYSTIDADYLPASALGPHGVLLPEAVYDAAGHISGTTAPDGDYQTLYRDLHVISIRIDPCFAELQPDPHGAGCTNQVRLVFQQLAVTNGVLMVNPSALHAFYEISRDDLVALTQAIVSLRIASLPGERLGPLAPHPIIVKEGLDGAFASGIRALVLRYAGGDSLTRVTEMTEPAASWLFLAFDVARDTHEVTPISIPTLGTTYETFNQLGYDPASGWSEPPPTSPDRFPALGDIASADRLSSDEAQRLFGGLVRVDNPTRNSQNTIDCVSCHLATPASLWIAAPRRGLVEAQHPDAYHADSRWVLASEMSPTWPAALSTARFNIHSFSYIESWPGASWGPGISQRTVNESAAIVAYLNATK